MGQVTVKVPDVGEGVAEVELVSWAVADGDIVARDQIVAEVMTDKATVEVPSPIDGVIRGLAGSAGDKLLVGEALFVLEIEGEGDQEVEAEAAPPDASADASPPVPVPSPSVPDASADASPARANASAGASTAIRIPRSVGAPRAEGRKPTATPAVRRRAREAGIDLRTVIGSGPAGRITHDDLDEVFRRPAPAGPRSAIGFGLVRSPDTSTEDRPIIGLRRRIAEQMVASASTIPHITYVEEVDMTALEELRGTLNESAADGARLTILPFLIRALVKVLPEFAMCNAHVLDDDPSNPATLRTFGGVHVGVATQTGGGLVVPVVRHAEAETLWSTASRVADMAEAARTGGASPGELSGSTITITSLGALGGVVTTPVINKPETTVVGVNKLAVRPVWDGDRFVPRQMMNLSSSFDHRVVDGWDAARFVQAIKRLLEQPALLFVEEPMT